MSSKIQVNSELFIFTKPQCEITNVHTRTEYVKTYLHTQTSQCRHLHIDFNSSGKKNGRGNRQGRVSGAGVESVEKQRAAEWSLIEGQKIDEEYMMRQRKD